MKKTTLIWLWLGVLCVSTASVWGILWIEYMLFFDSYDSVEHFFDSYDGTEYFFEGPGQRYWLKMLSMLYTIYILFLSGGAATIFLNYFKKVRSNKWFRFLSFFLVPLFMIAAEINSRNRVEEIFVMLPASIPFVLCLSVAYILFIRSLKIDGQQTYCSQFCQKQNQFPVH